MRALSIPCGILLGLVLTTNTQALTVTYPLSFEFSMATAPEGLAPWMTATFDDGGTPGSVDLFLEAPNLTGGEFAFEWLFNLDPNLTSLSTNGLADLIFSAPIKTGAFTDPTINLGEDAFMANGDGSFDIQIVFDMTDGPNRKFGSGDAALFTITGIPTLTANDFDFLSTPGPGGSPGPFPTAAFIGGIGEADESAWISIPEPATMSILLVGGLAVLRRKPK